MYECVPTDKCSVQWLQFIAQFCDTLCSNFVVNWGGHIT